MATTAAPQADVYPSPFPAPSKSASGLIEDTLTEVSSTIFSDKIFITISQAGKLAHWVHVPLSTASADPMSSGPVSSYDSENNLLPMSHLTATTVLGGTKRDEEVIGQTIATTIASAILMKRPHEERLLVLGVGLQSGMAGRTQFDEITGLVLEVL
ncbi:uncharacterized protein RCC_09370 [Ramularia collo-cygni]|uniref:Uncharacterized protein n=1 Tax=Ramularia collo-cygni TaxID=112498 RepID=A0A2D3V2Q9_9PEZI|nr:uncharacterized protein RCC_09370 [Ramularia collo-cygni]CZT23656.1 uncharacterized protein RCC_09370 [Ramularia collo-cygni]